MTDWSTIASLATAGGTLVLAVATFASIRSANRSVRTSERSARIAEQSLLAGQRPLLVNSRLQEDGAEQAAGELSALCRRDLLHQACSDAVMPDIQILADIQAGNPYTVRAEDGKDMAAVAFSVVNRLRQRDSSRRAPAVPGRHLTVRDFGISGQGLPARAQLPGQVGQGFQRDPFPGQRLSRALASHRGQVTLIRADQVVQRVVDRPVRAGRRRMERFLIQALAGLDQQQSRPGLMTEQLDERLIHL